MKRKGYQIHIIFVWISSVQLALKRIQDRVKRGGHSIPPNVVRRRYGKGLRNFFQQYRVLADSWILIDNSGNESIIIAENEREKLKVLDAELYDRILKTAGKV